MTPTRSPLLERVEPTLGAEEAAYRRHFLATDTTYATVAAWIILIMSGGVIAFEITAFSADLITRVLAVRAGFAAIAIPVMLSVRRGITPERLDRAALIFSTAFALQFVALFALRPPGRVDDAALIVLILAGYALSPASLPYRAAAPLVIGIGSVLVLLFVRDMAPLSLWPSIMIVASANALGMWGSSRHHTQRRRQYQAQERLRASLQERDLLIERLRHSHKMESMGRIVGGVAHDFNNILGSMLVSVDLLLEDLPKDDPSRPEAETLRTSVKRGADLTRQLLAFSRQQVLEPKVVNLNDLVRDTEMMLVRTLFERVAITVSLDERVSAVRVDPVQVQQILLNLSVNARDAMPHGGTLLLQTRNERLTDALVMGHSVAPPGSYVVLTVSDSGVGMDDATMSRMFEPFFTTKPKGQGTGLGLSTVFGIVEQSSGHIRVKSAPGRGTTFDIFLPAVAEHPAPAIARPTPTTDTRGTETILLAEDDESLRRLLARVLTSRGYHVLQAGDGAEALRVAERHSGPLHLLASDVVMPVMDGQRLATELVQRRPGIKVLFMSGYTEDAFTDGGLRPGDVFLQKPVDPATLTQRVRAMLDEQVN